MNDEILEIINKNLPNLHAQQLGKILDKAVSDAAEVERLKKLLISSDNKIGDLEEEIRRLERYKGELSSLDAEKEKLRIAQLTFDVEKKLLEQKVQCEKEKTDLLNSTLGVIFRSPIIVENITKNVVNESTSYDYQNRPMVNKFHTPVTETKTVSQQ